MGPFCQIVRELVNLDVGGCEYLYMILELHSATCFIAKPTYCSEVVPLLKMRKLVGDFPVMNASISLSMDAV